MLNWHSFIGIHVGYFSHFSPGKTLLVVSLSQIHSYFRHSGLLLRRKIGMIWKWSWHSHHNTNKRCCHKKEREGESFFVFVFIFSWEKCHMYWSHISKGGAQPQDAYFSHWKGVAVNKLIQTMSTSSTFCPSSCACYWLIYLREEILLTHVLSKFLKKISALKGNRGSSSGSKKSLIFHL